MVLPVDVVGKHRRFRWGAFVSGNISPENTGAVYYDSTCSVETTENQEKSMAAGTGSSLAELNQGLQREHVELLRERQKE